MDKNTIKAMVDLIKDGQENHAVLGDFLSLLQGWSPPDEDSNALKSSLMDQVSDLHQAAQSRDLVEREQLAEEIQAWLGSDSI